MPALKACATGGCPEQVPRGVTYCAGCEAVRRSKPSGDRRRYGKAHKALREAHRPIVEAGGAVCARCGQPIGPGEPWQEGHRDPESAGGPEHAYCNSSGGARLGNRRRGQPG